jgi:Fur family peroxide stress response transcriptional regulator
MSKRQNFSRQRKAVLDTVCATREHPTAEMVYSALKEENPKISLATVYRNLNLLADTGDILKLSIPGRCDRFDGFTKEHLHLYCVSCGKIEDIEGLDTSNIDRDLERLSGFKLLKKEIVLY